MLYQQSELICSDYGIMGMILTNCCVNERLENIFVNFHELRTVYFFKVSLCQHSTVNVMLPCCHATIVVDLAVSLNFLYNRILCKECNKCDVGLPAELHSKKTMEALQSLVASQY